MVENERGAGAPLKGTNFVGREWRRERHQETLKGNRGKTGSKKAKAELAAERIEEARVERHERTLELGKTRLHILAASMGEWPRESMVLTDSANAEG